MTGTQIVPDWFSLDVETLVRAGDVDGIRYKQRAAETLCVQAVRDGDFDEAQAWARRAAVAEAGFRMAVSGVRELRRAEGVTEELMERDA